MFSIKGSKLCQENGTIVSDERRNETISSRNLPDFVSSLEKMQDKAGFILFRKITNYYRTQTKTRLAKVQSSDWVLELQYGTLYSEARHFL